MRNGINAIGYQIASLLAMYAAGIDQAWLGIAACVVFIAVQLVFSQTRARDSRAMLCALLVGIALDGTWAATGLIAYASPMSAWLAPAWILVLWATFAMTFNHSLHWLRGRLWLAALLGAIGGPLAYWGAERVFSAISLSSPAWLGLGLLSMTWAMAIPLIAWSAGIGASHSRVRREGAVS